MGPRRVRVDDRPGLPAGRPVRNHPYCPCILKGNGFGATPSVDSGVAGGPCEGARGTLRSEDAVALKVVEPIGVRNELTWVEVTTPSTVALELAGTNRGRTPHRGLPAFRHSPSRVPSVHSNLASDVLGTPGVRIPGSRPLQTATSACGE